MAVTNQYEPRCSRSSGLVGPEPPGGRRPHLVPYFGPYSRVACPGAAPPQRAPPERRVRGIPTEPGSPRNRTRPLSCPAPPQPKVARKTGSRSCLITGKGGERTGHAPSRAGARAPHRRNPFAEPRGTVSPTPFPPPRRESKS